MHKLFPPFGLLLFAFGLGCANEITTTETKASISFNITELSDEDYPDNPDIGFRASDYQSEYFELGELSISDIDHCQISFFSSNGADTVQLNELSLLEFIPKIPERFKSDEYLSLLTVVNQEWNRNQVRFLKGEFNCSSDKISRVDLARNCLNAKLWEVIVYVQEGDKTLPYVHGWFDFPEKLYAELFEQRNQVPYSTYSAYLDNWKQPESKTINFDQLRTVHDRSVCSFEDLSFEMYPIAGAREKKFKEIIYPTQFKSMKDLQTDSSLFATFSQPGFYNCQSPRTTELGRFYHLNQVEFLETSSSDGKNNLELVFHFSDEEEERQTQLNIGGLDLAMIPALSPQDANKGWKNSMGFGNHSFYEGYNEHKSLNPNDNPYFAALFDEELNWLDSHQIGIDGPVIHVDDVSPYLLHVWLLSFERHAFVGHYVISLEPEGI